MRIEMLGPPTSGKTSLVRELICQGIGAGSPHSYKIIPKKWNAFADRIRETYDDRELFKKQLQTLPTKTLNALGTAYYGDKFKGPVVYDELVALCGLSLAIRHKGDWQWYFEEMPMPGLLVVLECSDETVISRNQARGDRNRTAKSLRAFHKMPEIIEILKKRKGGKILFLNTDKLSTYQCAKKVIKCL